MPKPPRGTSSAAIRSSTRPTAQKVSNAPHSGRIAPVKAEKRATKHAKLLSRVQKNATRGDHKNASKIRRPKNKLATSISSLEQALPSIQDGSCPMADLISSKNLPSRTLKSRPGASKRKEKVIASEIQRFGKNLALMQTAKSQSQPGHERWEAIRKHIEMAAHQT